MLDVSESEGGVLLPVKIVPGASRTRFLGEWQGRARIAVAAAPEKGKANQAVIDLISGLLDIHGRQVAVIAGTTSPLKTIRIEGVTAVAVQAAFQPHRS
jgi:uncharacterized protein